MSSQTPQFFGTGSCESSPKRQEISHIEHVRDDSSKTSVTSVAKGCLLPMKGHIRGGDQLCCA